MADASFDPWEMCVTAANFAEHVRIMDDLDIVLPLGVLLSGLDAPRPTRRRIAITFDDGYVDNLEAALPTLERVGMPATFFVTTGFLGKEFWWDELERLLMSSGDLPERIQLDLRPEPLGWDVSGRGTALEERRSLLTRIHRCFMALESGERDDAMRQIEAQTGGTHSPLPTKRAMSADEVLRLSRCDGVEIGAHSVSHRPLSGLDLERQRSEIIESAATLSDLVGGTVVGFSYPHGEWSTSTPDLVEEAGLAYACTSMNDGVRPRTRRYLLPRVFPGNVDGDGFRNWLNRWIGPC